MADLKISQLTVAGALTGAELIELVQGGVNVKGTVSAIGTLFNSSYWSLSTGATLIGVNNITSNVAAQLNFTGTWIASANNQYHTSFAGSFTGRASQAADFLNGYQFTPTLTTGTNGQTLTAVLINPTFIGTGTFYPLRIFAGYDYFSINYNGRVTIGPPNSLIANSVLQVRGLTTATGSARPMVIEDSNGNLIYSIYDNGSIQINSTTTNPYYKLISNSSITAKIQASDTYGGTVIGSETNNKIGFIVNNSVVASIDTSGILSVPAEISIGGNVYTGSGFLSSFLITPASPTALTSGVEVIDINFNLARTIQFAGNTANSGFQRAINISAPTYSYASATGIIAKVATMYLSGRPLAGSNTGFSNSYTIYLDGNNASAANNYGLYNLETFGGTVINASFNGGMGVEINSVNKGVTVTQGGGAGTIAGPILSLTAGAWTGLSATVEFTDINMNLGRTIQFATGAITTQRFVRIQRPTISFVGASTVTDAVLFDVEAAPVQGTLATLTRSWSARFAGNSAFGASVFIGSITTAPNVSLDISGGLALRQVTNSSLGASQNDYAIGAGSSFRITPTASINITGLTGGFDGKILIIRNTSAGAFNLVFTNEDALSAAANRINTSTAGNLTIAPRGVLILQYDATISRWFDIAVR